MSNENTDRLLFSSEWRLVEKSLPARIQLENDKVICTECEQVLDHTFAPCKCEKEINK